MPVDYPEPPRKPISIALPRGQMPMVVVGVSFLVVLGLLMAVVPLFTS